jgi:uncharacterized protein YecT (DUF1311 family)
MRYRIELHIGLIICLCLICSAQEWNTPASEGPQINYINADRKLNEIYQQILKKEESNKSFINNLRVAQRLWIKFRDAQFELRFPESNGHYGNNTLTNDRAIYLTKLTQERIQTLMEILDPTLAEFIAYYPFNGNASDESGNGNHGIIHGPVLTKDRFDNSFSAYEFDGVNDYIDLQYRPNLSISMGSIIAWIKTSSSVGNQVLILGQGYGRPQLVIISGRAKIQWGATDKTFPSVTSISGVDDTKWHCIAGLWSQSDFRIYIDGILEASGTGSTTQYASDCSIQIGGFNLPPCGYAAVPYVNQFFNGTIDDIRIYNKLLTEEEINALYHEGDY